VVEDLEEVVRSESTDSTLRLGQLFKTSLLTFLAQLLLEERQVKEELEDLEELVAAEKEVIIQV
jgi:hypothetical protein